LLLPALVLAVALAAGHLVCSALPSVAAGLLVGMTNLAGDDPSRWG